MLLQKSIIYIYYINRTHLMFTEEKSSQIFQIVRWYLMIYQLFFRTYPNESFSCYIGLVLSKIYDSDSPYCNCNQLINVVTSLYFSFSLLLSYTGILSSFAVFLFSFSSLLSMLPFLYSFFLSISVSLTHR